MNHQNIFTVFVLFLEGDGQISFVIPEREPVEKQITGQLNIADVLEEWERIKAEAVDVEAYKAVLAAEVNKSMPAYSKIGLVEIMAEPFARKPLH